MFPSVTGARRLLPLIRFVSTATAKQKPALRRHSMCFVYSIREGRRLNFGESVLDRITDEDEATVSLYQYGDNVAIDSIHPDAIHLVAGRLPGCPLSRKNRVNYGNVLTGQSTGMKRPHIAVASVCLLQSPNADGLLLTQRPWHMRSYPGVWVPPGGHCEFAEPPQVAAVRELCEELGFDAAVKGRWEEEVNITPSSLIPLCAWEATYPCYSPSPIYHQLVLYFVATWPQWLNSQTHFVRTSSFQNVSSSFRPPLPRLNLQSDEVRTAIWLPTSVLEWIIQDWALFQSLGRNSSGANKSPLTSSGTVESSKLSTPIWYWQNESRCWDLKAANEFMCPLKPQGRREPEDCSSAKDLSKPTPVSTGTAYAVTNWLSKLHQLD
ncbi:unnamed protein product [Calicophoron daubneyi]|uniref:Nudix hydrolase domain-containing protein n=1 Tax=Calicophoron daubneyi TaxID=300641 RepID=A0AAV2TVC3_CALDB